MKLTLKIISSVFIGMVFLEITLRMISFFSPSFKNHMARGGAHPQHLVIPDEKIGYVLNPNFSCKETNDNFEYLVSVKINSQGLRDYEHNLFQDNFKILGIGDSYTFGEGVELNETYLRILEQRLKQNFTDEIEIFKAGAPGYSTRQEVNFLEKDISKFKPKIVILALLPSETFRNENPYTYCHGYIVESRKKDKLYLVGGKLYYSRAENIILANMDAWFKHYYLTRQFFSSRRLKKLFSEDKKESVSNKSCPLLDKEQLNQKYKITFELLKKYKNICLKNAATPILVIIEGDSQEDGFIKNFANSIGLASLSLLPYFKKAAEDNIPYHYKYDLHWNANGHRIAANAIYDFLTTQNLINLKSKN